MMGDIEILENKNKSSLGSSHWVLNNYATAFDCCFDSLDQPIRIVLPFKDQRSADAVQKDLRISARKLEEICAQCLPVEKSLMISKVWRPPLINQHCIVYKFSCTVICAIQIMSDTHPNTSFNASPNINILLLVNTLKKDTACIQLIYKTSLQF